MRTPNIRDARDLCNRLGVRAVMVIALTEDNVSGASYAQTKTECGQTAHTLDKTIEGITDALFQSGSTAGKNSKLSINASSAKASKTVAVAESAASFRPTAIAPIFCPAGWMGMTNENPVISFRFISVYRRACRACDVPSGSDQSGEGELRGTHEASGFDFSWRLLGWPRHKKWIWICSKDEGIFRGYLATFRPH